MDSLQEVDVPRRWAEGQTDGPAGIGIRFLPDGEIYKISRVVLSLPRPQRPWLPYTRRTQDVDLLHFSVPGALQRRARRLGRRYSSSLIRFTHPQLEGGSAARSGQVAIGDRLHAISGVDVRSLSVEDVIHLIKGPPGTFPPPCVARWASAA